ncbi:ABC transporter permease [Arthrobacter sp. Soil762]|uniref:ABC transporter permease n=1 Tax=Arthrobacter sp. Soil762 TaxID=1736401 RepID=UPI000701EDB4|nr:ABC transporter permease [Arthrobacter sp. Soil762]KRE72682.1 ABC transporter permease [Arthrobacter sp. Soil762]
MTTTINPLESQELAAPVRWRTPGMLTAFALAAGCAFVFFQRPGTTTFRLSSENDAIRLPNLEVSTVPAGVGLTIALLLLAGYSVFLRSSGRKTPRWLIAVFAVLLVAGFLIWAGSGGTLPVSGLLVATLGVSVPLILGSLSGVISERVGVVNVAIEGQFLAGAFAAAVVASVTGNVIAGLAAAMIAGALVAAVLALFAIRYLVDQVIVGVVLNVLVTGLTTFLFTQVLSPNNQQLNSPPRFAPIDIPVLSDIPIIGQVLFSQTLIVYLMFVAVAAVYYGLFHTRWGLRLRAVGEHPQAADTVGIAVNATRVRNVLLGGVVAGLGGSYFTLGSVGSFNIQMTAGAGFIALAAVIFGRWDPVRSTMAALLFGFASSLQYVLSIMGSQVPSEFMLMLPYLVTILAVAGFAGKMRGPAAAGKPYTTA